MTRLGGRFGGEVGELLLEFGKVCKRLKLRVNVDTIEVMRCSRNDVAREFKVHVNGKFLEKVKCF